MKLTWQVFLLFFTSLFSVPVFASHIAGGEMHYKLVKQNGATNTYEITLRLFRECNPPPSSNGVGTADLPPSVLIAIFNNTSPSTQYGSTHTAPMSGSLQILKLTTINPCISNAPEVCYQVANYTFQVDLPVTADGYVGAFQTCCRTNGIANLAFDTQGGTYTCTIPGTKTLANSLNSSPVFSLKDTTLICKNSNFSLDFSATDPDGDILTYSFCSAYDGGPTTNANPVTPSNPPYGTLQYKNPFSGANPLGSTVSINPNTGIISGISPDAGSYVINVCVSEFRNGTLINIHRKDFTLKIGDCSLTSAQLDPVYYSCDSFRVSFQNQSMSSTITSYLWDFGVNNSTSTQPTPTFTYPDTGAYTVKLTVSNSSGCKDSATEKVLVYPVFSAGFMVSGSCFINPYTFTDTSKGNYGLVDKWRWDFGDLTTTADTSIQKTATYQYSSTGDKTVTLFVSNTKGCSKTVTKILTVSDKPIINLPFKDTLICSIDTLRLAASSSQGTYSWGPAYNIINANTASPLVYPKVTTYYTVTVNASGCINKDSVKVNVLDFISVDAGADASICITDSTRMQTVSQALSYQWSPVTGLNNPTIKFPTASPPVTTKYFVIANLGKCQARDSVTVRVAPFPQARAGNDTLICFGTSAQLHGEITGTSFTWRPTNTLTGFNTLNPVARPTVNTAYILMVSDTLGCKKNASDTIVVAVQPKIIAFAGNDTTVVINQPLQLNATGGTTYFWTPATGLNNSTISNPVATLNSFIDSITYTVTVNSNGCAAQDNITVRVFKTKPDLFVPTAFTPNGDGKNDVLKVVPVGIKKFEYLQVYNRWGQLLFQTTDPEKGWDGKFSGLAQPSGTYVFVARGIDYLDNAVLRKGTCVLIR